MRLFDSKDEKQTNTSHAHLASPSRPTDGAGVVAVEGTQANEVFAVGHNPGQKKNSRRKCADTFFYFFFLFCQLVVQGDGPKIRRQ